MEDKLQPQAQTQPTVEMIQTAPQEIKQTNSRYVYRANKKQKLFMEYWTDPSSPTFANIYKSGLKSGFSPTYSKNLANVAPQWLLTYIDKMQLEEQHIEQGITKIATGEINSKSIDDTRLRAYELLMKLKGLDSKKQQNITVNVQPILASASRKVIDQE